MNCKDLSQAIADRLRFAFRDFDKEMGSGLLLATGTVLGAVAVLRSFQPEPAEKPEPAIIPIEEPEAPFHTATDSFRAFPLVLNTDEPEENPPVTMKPAAEAFAEIGNRDEPRRRRRHHRGR